MRLDSPQVGQNLQDHLVVMAEHDRVKVSPMQSNLRFDRIIYSILSAYLLGRGFATDVPAPASGFIKTNPKLSLPDIQFILRTSSAKPHPWFPFIRRPFLDALGIWVVLLNPKSRGHLELRSHDPKIPLRIYQNFLSDESDRISIRKGLQLARELFAVSPLAEFVGEETEPGLKANDYSVLVDFICRTAVTVSHPVGTCKMGIKDSDVVDPELRLRGIENLRVVDASVMPSLVGGNINATVIAIAEKAADIIRRH